jgi:hypothetical protein
MELVFASSVDGNRNASKGNTGKNREIERCGEKKWAVDYTSITLYHVKTRWGNHDEEVSLLQKDTL